MKKISMIAILFVMAVFSGVNAQNLKNDCKFQKSVNLIYSSIYQYDEVKRDDLETSKSIPILSKNLVKLKSEFSEIKTKYSTDEDFKEFENWVLVLEKSLESLKKDDSVWQMGYTLVKLNLNDFMKLKY